MDNKNKKQNSKTPSKKNPQKLQKQEYSGLLFNKRNYMWMLIGVAVVALGMLLMSGGRNTNPAVFDTSLVYSARRITVAPLVILLGFLIEIYAILQRPAVSENEI